ncbi:hypothetical protein M011DRAFT_313452 [Sporormia fimetaria CBS 119925]|uniref:Uncharacterized protein n=1 Tax=Sporormia fimetaria CBS 119925 TaxID=1340428 RepID=A0A6A6UWY5_9PLEO|nr:hypothetical protein M011DRAFT_313452 [Sporormia fimetaria CBS 119925]
MSLPTEPAITTPVKRGRGRPRKSPVTASESSTATTPIAEDVVKTNTRKASTKATKATPVKEKKIAKPKKTAAAAKATTKKTVKAAPVASKTTAAKPASAVAASVNAAPAPAPALEKTVEAEMVDGKKSAVPEPAVIDEWEEVVSVQRSKILEEVEKAGTLKSSEEGKTLKVMKDAPGGAATSKPMPTTIQQTEPTHPTSTTTPIPEPKTTTTPNLTSTKTKTTLPPPTAKPTPTTSPRTPTTIPPPRPSRPAPSSFPAPPRPPFPPPAPLPFGGSKPRPHNPEYQGYNELPKRYRPAARRVTAIIVGLPILLVTSWELWRRCKFCRRKKTLHREAKEIVKGDYD